MVEKKRSALTIALLLGCVFTGHAFGEPAHTSLLVHSQAQELFHESVDLADIHLLSKEEMQSTEGAINPLLVGAVVGAATAAGGYGLGVKNGNYSYSTKGLVGNIATGATIGALTGGAGAAAGGGLSTGANIWRVNGAAANFSANQVWRQTCGRTSHGPMCAK